MLSSRFFISPHVLLAHQSGRRFWPNLIGGVPFCYPCNTALPMVGHAAIATLAGGCGTQSASLSFSTMIQAIDSWEHELKTLELAVESFGHRMKECATQIGDSEALKRSFATSWELRNSFLLLVEHQGYAAQRGSTITKIVSEIMKKHVPKADTATINMSMKRIHSIEARLVEANFRIARARQNVKGNIQGHRDGSIITLKDALCTISTLLSFMFGRKLKYAFLEK